jgi:hypothetical protein
VVLPGAFKTNFGGGMLIVGTPIDDYDKYREMVRKLCDYRVEAPDEGNPEKGMDALVDFVRGEGRAAGIEGWPICWATTRLCAQDFAIWEKQPTNGSRLEQNLVQMPFDNLK